MDETVETHVGRLGSYDCGERTGALGGLLRMFERSVGLSCETVGDHALRLVVTCGTAARSRDELILAWRVLAHVAVYFADASRLFAAGVADAALDATFSREASVASRRAVTRTVASLVATHPDCFVKYVDSDPAERLLTASPAMLAHVALAVQDGVLRLARQNVLAHLITVTLAHERVLARDLLHAALAHPSEECKPQVRRAVAVMLCDPLAHAEQLATVAWWNGEDPLGDPCADHYRPSTVIHAITAASRADQFDVQMAVLDFVHALQDNAAVDRPIVALEVFTWMRRPSVNRQVRAFGLSYVSSCCKRNVASAAAVADASGGPTPLVADESDDALLYLAGDVFAHESVAATHEEALEHSVREKRVDGHAPIYFAASLVEHRVGARIVGACALEVMRARARDADEVDAETARLVVEVCERQERTARLH